MIKYSLIITVAFAGVTSFAAEQSDVAKGRSELKTNTMLTQLNKMRSEACGISRDIIAQVGEPQLDDTWVKAFATYDALLTGTFSGNDEDVAKWLQCVQSNSQANVLHEKRIAMQIKIEALSEERRTLVRAFLNHKNIVISKKN